MHRWADGCQFRQVQLYPKATVLEPVSALALEHSSLSSSAHPTPLLHSRVAPALHSRPHFRLVVVARASEPKRPSRRPQWTGPVRPILPLHPLLEAPVHPIRAVFVAVVVVVAAVARPNRLVFPVVFVVSVVVPPIPLVVVAVVFVVVLEAPRGFAIVDAAQQQRWVLLPTHRRRLRPLHPPNRSLAPHARRREYPTRVDARRERDRKSIVNLICADEILVFRTCTAVIKYR